MKNLIKMLNVFFILVSVYFGSVVMKWVVVSFIKEGGSEDFKVGSVVDLEVYVFFLVFLCYRLYGYKW